MKKECRPGVTLTLARTWTSRGERSGVQDSVPPRTKREKPVPDVKRESHVPEGHGRRRRKSHGTSRGAQDRKTPEIELQKTGPVCVGIALTCEGDARDETDLLHVRSVRDDGVGIKSGLTGLEFRWPRARVGIQALKLKSLRLKRHVRLSRAEVAATQRSALAKLGECTTRCARVQRLRALQVIGGEGRALINRVEALSGKKAEADAIAREFI